MPDSFRTSHDLNIFIQENAFDYNVCEMADISFST